LGKSRKLNYNTMGYPVCCNIFLAALIKSQARPVTPEDLQIPTQYEGMPTVIIEDGNILEDNLRENNLSKEWLYSKLQEMGIQNENEILTATLDTRGRLYSCKKN